ncbi:MAG TPA: PAS domain-containing sensor histidine kinase [Longimicrobiales bacterium]|nr:PAS domain-containing sensor histidine kinase [Longimicrobiales bacterium]
MMSEIQNLRDQLRASEARFRDVIENNADAIVVVDEEGAIQFFNQEAERLFGERVSVGSAFGFPIVAGETTELDTVRDGTPVVVDMRVVDSHWQGQPACLATLRDVTQRKEQEERARDLIRAQAAQAVAEEVAGRFKFLAESTAVLSGSLDSARTLADLARLCTDEIADWVIIYSYEGSELRRSEVVHCDPAKAELAAKLRDYGVNHDADAIAKLLKTRQPQLASRIDDEALDAMIPDEVHRKLVREMGVASFMIIPMVARQRLLGAISFISASPDKLFKEADVQLASDLAARAALAIDNARLYEEARQANQAKTELLAIISHDLRTPLNSIIGYGQLLGMGIPEPLPEAAKGQLERILVSAKHQLYLIDQLLSFARLDSNHEKVELTPVDVRSVAREAIQLIETQAHEKNLAVRLDMPDEPVVTATDPDKLRQVVINLLANAVRYTESGEITLELAASQADDVLVLVSDTGIGISAKNLPHVFEPFWQVDPGQRTRGGGTGLGLAVVKQVVALLGGSVSAKSVVGKGSTFQICLPRNSA